MTTSTKNGEFNIETQVITVNYYGASHKILVYAEISLDELQNIFAALFPSIGESKILALRELSRESTDGIIIPFSVLSKHPSLISRNSEYTLITNNSPPPIPLRDSNILQESLLSPDSKKRRFTNPLIVSSNSTVVCPFSTESSSNMTTIGSSRTLRKSDEGPSFQQFEASHLYIGTWSVSKNSKTDLYALFDTKKLVVTWYWMEGSLGVTNNLNVKKYKVQFKSSDIAGMHIHAMNEVDVTLDLCDKPVFYKKEGEEWTLCGDITGGQATICKRHRIRFIESDAKKLQSFLNGQEIYKKILDKGNISLFATPNELLFPTKSQTV